MAHRSIRSGIEWRGGIVKIKLTGLHFPLLTIMTGPGLGAGRRSPDGVSGSKLFAARRRASALLAILVGPGLEAGRRGKSRTEGKRQASQAPSGFPPPTARRWSGDLSGPRHCG